MGLGMCCLCDKMLSHSKDPMGNQLAWANPDFFALYQGTCETCGKTYCADCLEKNGRTCPDDNRKIEIVGPQAIPYSFFLQHKEALYKLHKENEPALMQYIQDNFDGTEVIFHIHNGKKETDNFSLNGLNALSEKSEELFRELRKRMLPAVCVLTGRQLDLIDKEITGPVILPFYRTSGECAFVSSSECEIRLYEGLFTMFRCVLDTLFSQTELPMDKNVLADRVRYLTTNIKNKNLQRETAVESLRCALEIFWNSANNPWFALHDEHRPTVPDYSKSLVGVLFELRTGLNSPARKRDSQLSIVGLSMFSLAHELGHYITKVTMNDEEVRKIGFIIENQVVRSRKPTSKDWGFHWAEEIIADLNAVKILTSESFSSSGGREGENLSEVYNYAFLTLLCLHMLEFYRYVRHGVELPSPNHPPAFKRKEFLTQVLPATASGPITFTVNYLWAEMESIFYEIILRLQKEDKLSLKGDDKIETLNYFKDSKVRFYKEFVQK
jgi:hypothetical protein